MNVAGIVDEYGEIDRQIALIRPALVRAAELRDQLEEIGGTYPADAAILLEGSTYYAQMGRRAMRRTVRDMSKLWRHLGREVFLRICIVPVGAIERLVSAEEAANLLVSDRTGPRVIKTVARLPVTL